MTRGNASHPKTVAVFGGGVAGLTAAHELADRGFAVTVFEKSGTWGGKVRSARVTGENQTPFLPGEHGFHFVPGFYRHLPDTMARIPIGQAPSRRTVANNLVGCTRTLVARETPLPDLDFPNRIRTLEDLLQLRRAVRGLGLPLPEIPYFLNRVRILATSCDQRFDEELEGQTWWDFIGADKKFLGFDDRSSVYKTYLAEVPVRSLVAMDPHRASARTVGRTALRLWADLLYPVSTDTQAFNVLVDRVLNGPTNEVWIDPWVGYLSQHNRVVIDTADTPSGLLEKDGQRRFRAMPVKFVSQAAVLSVSVTNGRIGQVRVRRWGETLEVLGKSAERVRESSMPPAKVAKRQPALAAVGDPLRAAREAVPADDGMDRLKGYLDSVRPELEGWIEVHGAGGGGDKDWLQSVLKAAEKADEAGLRALLPQGQGDPAAQRHHYEEDLPPFDYYVFALPLPTMYKLVERNADLQADASLRRLPLLRSSTGWMVGMQFYLRRDVPIARGHVILVDAPWALTAISQGQFWQDGALANTQVHGVISVIISNWNADGDYLGKSARECTREEIKNEVWSELKAHLNDADKGITVLRDEDLVDWHLADSLEEVPESAARALGDDVVLNGNGRVWRNTEQLVINTVGSLKNRPESSLSFSNMFLAGDYVRTNTDLATMESANESARTAANCILELDGFQKDELCKIWPLDLNLPKALALAHEKATQLDAVRYTMERTYKRNP
jgi:uncharacterized protein with NAD-binding domain and iron-sulfur cluster